MSFLPLHPRSTRAIRPAGNGNWFSLGPPGGDVFDAAASTVDANIVLAGLAPGGSFGGTLYRSTTEVIRGRRCQPLNGTSVFDIEFAPDGSAYIGTQDSVRKSTDGGISWASLNLGIGTNDQVFDVALDPRIPRSCGLGSLMPVGVNRSTSCVRPIAARHGQIARRLSQRQFRAVESQSIL